MQFKPQIPDVARLGSLADAIAFLEKNQFNQAFQSAVSAIKERPFHPEAYLFLADIARKTGDINTAIKCARYSTALAPKWNEPENFLNSLKDDPRQNSSIAFDTTELDHLFQNRHRISVCIIARNEEQRIANCIASIKPIAFQIVLVDTGSTDRTPQIAEQAGTELYTVQWQDDFSLARNISIEKARGDWILILDADEELPPDQHKDLLDDIQRQDIIACRLPLLNVGKESEGICYVPRLFRNAPGAFFYGRIHEQIFPSLMKLASKFRMKVDTGNAVIYHYGYSAALTEQKIQRNLRLLKQAIQEQPDDLNLMMNLALELARSGNITEALNCYRKAFQMMMKLPENQIVPELRETLLTQYASYLCSANQFAEVVEILTSPIAQIQNGLTASLHYLLALAFIGLKKHREAIENLQQCIHKKHLKTYSTINPHIHTSAPYLCLALSYLILGNAIEAEKNFIKAIEIEPGAFKPSYEYARYLAGSGNPLEALQLLQKLIPNHFQKPELWQLGARIALNCPDFIQFAELWTGEAIKYCPDNIELLAYRAESLMVNGKLKYSLEIWKRLPPTPRNLSAAILCQIASDEPAQIPVPENETALSVELIHWYRRLINLNVVNLIKTLNKKLDRLEPVLPTAAKILRQALHQADKE